MPLLNTAKDVRAGTVAVARVYAAGRIVWQRETTKTKTWTARPSWAASYAGDGDKRTDTDDLYYGQVSTVWGNQRSLIGWDVPAELVNADSITSIDLELYNRWAYLNSGGLITLGAHNYGSEPNTWTAGRVDQDLKRVAAPKPGWVRTSLGSAWKAAFLAGAKGIALGPGPSSSTTYYGYAAGDTAGTLRPRLTITYTITTQGG